MEDKLKKTLQKVEDWLDVSSVSCPPSPHYNEIDIMEPGSDAESVIFETPLKPKDLFQKLKSCPVCKTCKESPSETFLCIQSHQRQLCLYCFQVFELNKVCKHFKTHNVDHSVGTLKCPFKDCSFQIITADTNWSMEHLYSELDFHVTHAHLPKSYLVIPSEDDDYTYEIINPIKKEFSSCKEDITKNNPQSESEPLKKNESRKRKILNNESSAVFSSAHGKSNGYENNTEDDRESEHSKKSRRSTQDIVEEEIVDIKESDNNRAIICRKELAKERKNNCRQADRNGIGRGSSGGGGGVQSLSLNDSSTSNDISVTPTATSEEFDILIIAEIPATAKKWKGTDHRMFVCGFCDLPFTLRKGLNNHYIRRNCLGMSNKSCFDCKCSFRGFSVLQSIEHLRQCGHNISSTDL